MLRVRLTSASAASGPTDAAPRVDQWSARQQQAELGQHTLCQNSLRRNTMMMLPCTPRLTGWGRSAQALVRNRAPVRRRARGTGPTGRPATRADG